tara:strand:+ start:7233 stop:7619 length:387 start_codon:yes stop_codon:yes gene_type:complete
MTTGLLEHVNFTVANPPETAAMLCDLFGWHIRWSGPSANGGHTVHVGTDDQYLALYGARTPEPADARSAARQANLNHVAIVVDDLDATETRVLAAGYQSENHGNYEPGRRFYFYDGNGIEFEVVSYAA